MIIECARLLADALAHPTYGVNEQIHLLETYGDHESPRSIKKVLDITRHSQVVTMNLGTDWPLLVVPMPSTFDLEGEETTTKRDTGEAGIRLAVAYISEASRMETQVGAVESMYMLRAIAMCIKEWMDNANISDRQAHDITIRDCLRISMAPGVAELPEAPELVVSGAVMIDVEVRDLNP